MPLDATAAHSAIDDLVATAEAELATQADAAQQQLAAVRTKLTASQDRPAQVVVESGQTMWSIATGNGFDDTTLVEAWNPDVDPSAMSVGTKLWLVDPATVPAGETPPPDPDPTPTPTPTPSSPLLASPLYGACPGGGTTGIAGVRSKYGPKASTRIFLGAQTELPTIPADAPPCHFSWKPTGTVTDAQLKAIADRLRNGDVATFDHEEDNNGIDADAAAVQAWKDQNNRLYDFMKAYKPGVLTGPVFTGGLMASYTADSRRKLWCTGLKGDLFGVDCDGVHISTGEPNYDRIDYKDEIDNCLRYMADPSNKGFIGLTVAEFMTARSVPPDNNNGDMRASWLARRADYMASKKTADGKALVYMILLFDTTVNGRPGNVLPNPSAELTLWKGRVASNPTR